MNEGEFSALEKIYEFEDDNDFINKFSKKEDFKDFFAYFSKFKKNIIRIYYKIILKTLKINSFKLLFYDIIII